LIARTDAHKKNENEHKHMLQHKEKTSEEKGCTRVLMKTEWVSSSTVITFVLNQSAPAMRHKLDEVGSSVGAGREQSSGLLGPTMRVHPRSSPQVRSV
jgi:hypothetical protein